MDKRDARLLGQQAQEEVRRQAIKLLKKGMKQVEVAAQLEVSRQHVGYWWKRYRQGGWNALKMRRRGRAFGAKRKLSAEQEKEVQKLITDKTPDQLKMKRGPADLRDTLSRDSSSSTESAMECAMLCRASAWF